MRDAIVITFTLIVLFALLGFMYNLMTPYFVKLGVIEEEEAIKKEEKQDGGIFRSMDFGRSWERASTVEGEGAFSKSDIFRIAVSPDDSQVFYAASSAGLYISRNGGDSWMNFLSDEKIAEKEESIVFFAIDPKNAARMYAAPYSKKKGGRIAKAKGTGFYNVYSTIHLEEMVSGIWIDSYDPSSVYAGTTRGLFLESKDFGESWRIKKEFEGAISGLAMVPGDTRIMYLAANGRVFKTVNQGKEWTDVAPLHWATYGAEFFINDLMVDPHEAQTLYVATSKGLFRSKDGARSFKTVALPVAEETPAIHSIYVDSQRPGLLFAGGGSRIYKSDDAGETWQIQSIDTERNISIILVKPGDTRVVFAGVKK